MTTLTGRSLTLEEAFAEVMRLRRLEVLVQQLADARRSPTTTRADLLRIEAAVFAEAGVRT